jgi:hypothetical protein
MTRKRAEDGRRKADDSSSPTDFESRAYERGRIRKSMLKWESMDGPARLLGRGLGRRELIGRVALEVGKTLREVHEALDAK